jgi:hypothetical protein
VCYNQYEEPPSERAPVSLACGHSICRGDAATILRIANTNVLKCPMRSSTTDAPQDGAAGLPVTFAVVGMLGLLTAAPPAPPRADNARSDARVDRLADLQDRGLRNSAEYAQLCAELKQLQPPAPDPPPLPRAASPVRDGAREQAAAASAAAAAEEAAAACAAAEAVAAEAVAVAEAVEAAATAEAVDTAGAAEAAAVVEAVEAAEATASDRQRRAAAEALAQT